MGDSIWDSYKDVIAITILALYAILMMVGVTALGLFFWRGLESSVNEKVVAYYQGFGIAFLVGLVLLKATEIIYMKFKSNKKIAKFSGWSKAFIFDFEDSILGDISKTSGMGWLRWFGKAQNQIIVALGISILMGVIFSIRNSFFTSLPPMVFQQIGKMGEGLLYVEPSSTAETLADIFFISVTFGFMRYFLQRKYKVDKATFWVLAFFGCLIVEFAWRLAIHAFAYSGEDIKVLGVVIFTFQTVLMTLLFGSIIVPLLMHQVNNLYQYLKESALASNDEILVVSIAIVVLVGVAYTLIKLRLWEKQKRKAVEFT